MKASPNCYAVIKHCEDRVLKAYPDPKSPLAVAIARRLPTAGLSGAPWTIGTGATGPGIGPGVIWTDQQAEDRLESDVGEREEDADHALLVQLTQGQYDAFISLLFNVGHGSPAKEGIIRLKNGYPSTLLRKLNESDFPGARAEWARWISPGTNVEHGLRKRRRMEQALFDGLDAAEAIALGDAV